MASADEGYEDERFESDVPSEFHCAICLNVLQQPMQCTRNEHSFCRPCILRYLQKFQRCPSCMEALTMQTLRPSRVVTAVVSQLKIKCDNVERGCPDIVKLENLEVHVVNCSFSPVKCPNEGCNVITNRKDQADHEDNECFFRKGKCEVCGKNVPYGKRKRHCYVTKTEMGEVREEISSIKEIVMNMSKELTRDMSQMKDQIDDLTQRMDTFSVQMAEKKDLTGGLTQQMAEMKCEIEKNKREGQSSWKQTQQSCIRTLDINIRNDVIIAGGPGEKSVEMFNWTTKQWTLLSSMTSERFCSSSFLHEGQMYVCGGLLKEGIWTNTIETLELKGENGKWKESQGKLPNKNWGHATTVYGENVFIFGGHSGDKVVNDVCKVSLVSPHSSQLVCHMPEARKLHGVQRFGDKVAIVGGTSTGLTSDALDTVVLYDIKRNCCRTLAPLPFAVSNMATVALGDSLIIIGGWDKNGDELNSVVCYDIEKQKSKILPSMKQKRACCAAVVTDNVIIVMGGWKKNDYLNSVEYFNFYTYEWEDLPSMKEERAGSTAVVKCVF